MRSTASAVIAIILCAAATNAQEHISFRTSDGWTIRGDLYGTGPRGVLLVHGGRYDKSSWEPQAGILAKAGFLCLAIDLRGYGESKEGPASARADYGSPLDVLGAVRYLRDRGAKTVSVVGSSMGGDATEQALEMSEDSGIDRAILLAHGAYGPAEKLKGRKLFIVSRDDIGPGDQPGVRQPRLLRIQAQFEKAPEPKKLVVLEGSAHAQAIFQTAQARRLMDEILKFLEDR